jgi:hypothetical protein
VITAGFICTYRVPATRRHRWLDDAAEAGHPDATDEQWLAKLDADARQGRQ